MNKESINKNIILTLLILTTTLMTMSTDLYAPSLPYLPEYLNTTPEMVKLTMSLWMMAYGGLLLIYGPLSEHFGRKPVLVVAMAVFTLTSFYCTVATTIEGLIVARVLQGAAAGAEGVLVLSIVRDCFDEKGQVRAFSVYRAVCALPPIFAPILGAYIFLLFGWQANFLILAGIAATVTLLLWRYLEESNNRDQITFSVKEIALDYGRLLCSGQFLGYTLIMATTIAYLVIFPTVVPFVLVNQLGYEADVFGYFQGSVMVAFILGSIVANRLAKRMTTSRLMGLGVGFVVLGAIVLGVVAVTDQHSLPLLWLPLALIAFGNGPLMSTAPPKAMSATNCATGASAAMMLTITSALASLTAVVEGAVSDGTTYSLAGILGAVALIALVVYLLVSRSRESVVKEQQVELG